METQINLEALAQHLAGCDNAIEFVLSLDAYVADMSFTRELIERLEHVVIEEEGSL
ncbi:hypothetical protein ABZ154_09155 [Streptomyces sp. NPDC006261]|uniref:hypothetical protein n=1 Tax=Streptomyces sp. NPDC006261 TaxID=3156739 RepID=UPI0033BED842